jgi:hypothetical protein
MANYFKKFNDYVEKFRKVMKILGIDVFDKNFGITIPTLITTFLVVLVNILVYFTLFLTIKTSRYVEMLKNGFMIGVAIQVDFLDFFLKAQKLLN